MKVNNIKKKIFFKIKCELNVFLVENELKLNENNNT